MSRLVETFANFVCAHVVVYAFDDMLEDKILCDSLLDLQRLVLNAPESVLERHLSRTQ